jgi:exosortase A
MKIERMPFPEMATQRPAAFLPERTLALTLLAAALFWMLAWYWDTAQSMVDTWTRSSTFAHGFLIVPISAWLIWQRRAAVAALDFRPDFRALPVLAAVGFVWILGRIGGAVSVQQFALVLMIPLAVWAVLGFSVLKELAFPLFFLLFAVPFGDFLEPLMMEHTADFTVAALRLTGIPVYREGQFLMLPTGNWSVVEACSGLRYLIASLTVGVLYAYLTYRSLSRRVLLTAASVIVPIVANWFRAYMIVMIGHLSGMKYAVGVDHILYGWVFFGLVMLLLFWVGSFWREDLDAPGAEAVTPRPATGALPLAGILAAAVAVASVVAVWPAAAERALAENRATPLLEVPAAAGAWQPVEGHLTEWVPQYVNPRAYLMQSYRNDTDFAGIYVGYYRNQEHGSRLVSYVNGLLATSERSWRIVNETRGSRVFDGREIPTIETTLAGPRVRLLIWRWYWIDGEHFTNPYLAKIAQIRSTLLGRGDDGAVVVVYAPYLDDRATAEKVLQGYVGSMLPSITRTLDNARGTGPSR